MLKISFGHLKQMLAIESSYPISEATIDRFLDSGRIITLNTYDPMIEEGATDRNVYVVRSGLIRGIYHDNNTERTAGFALPGTLLISFHSFYANEPSLYRFEACCPSEVIRIPRHHFDTMTADSHEFALWVMGAHQNQLYNVECKNRALTGDARMRLLRLTDFLMEISDRPVKPGHNAAEARLLRQQSLREISRLVPSKIIASYLGITEQHFSKIKGEILREK